MSEIIHTENKNSSLQEDIDYTYHVAVGYLVNAIQNRIKCDPSGAYYHRDTMMSEDEVAALDYLFTNAICILNRNINYYFNRVLAEEGKKEVELDNYAVSYIETREFTEKCLHILVEDSNGEAHTLEFPSNILTDKNFIDLEEKELFEEKIREEEEFKRLLKKYNYSAEQLEGFKNE